MAKLIDFNKEITRRTKEKALEVLYTCAECPNAPINPTCRACSVFRNFFTDLTKDDLEFIMRVIEEAEEKKE